MILKKKIDAEIVLANLLQKHKKVTMCDLNRVRTAVEKKVKSVYVDVTGDGIIWAVNRSPDLFSLRDGVVTRMSTWTSEYVDFHFNWDIPEKLRDRVLKALKGVKMEG